MRSLGLVFISLALGLGCKGSGSSEAATDPQAVKDQQELLARRDKLLQQRQELLENRDKVNLEIQQIEQQGGDASDKKKELADLNKQIDNSAELSQINTKLDSIKSTGDKSAQMASREAEVANREAQVAARERAVAEREKGLIQRDSDMAQRWKDSCSIAAPIVMAPPPGKGSYTKKDVSDLLARARAGMAKKGLLVSDLPAQAQSLESDATKALGDNKIETAWVEANQLVGTVDSQKIDRAFISAKIQRVNAQIAATKQTDPTQAQALQEIMTTYQSGDFNAANKRLNAVAAKLK
ncbi:MAG: hypothetical protein QM831_34315 [Kofleriaceae bacterium]